MTALHPALKTGFTEKFGVRYPIVQTGMGYVSYPPLVAATAEAGGLGILASATMSYDELVAAIAQVKKATDKPFAVNLRADAPDAADRIELMGREGIKVASFAQAPKKDLIKRAHDLGMLVVPSIGAKRHAQKVAEWGVDGVIVQGGEGGGHTGSIPTTLLLPQVTDVLKDTDVTVIAAGGFFDGRGLVAALAYGADAIAMGTRFLLTSDSPVGLAVKEVYLATDVNGTVVSKEVDGVPHRVLATDFVKKLEQRSTVARYPRAVSNALRFQKLSGTPIKDMVREGLAMKKSQGLSWPQVLMAANTPMLLKAAMVDGRPDLGVMASGQVVGVIDDLPSCQELIDRITVQASEILRGLEG
ncbi:NAD(P)H-dependent flavin oxidoreductase [Yinghuangia seranimata]|uniref:NAD(P)H-dependent flavin oxidoreductase n=1 Tax=Yinghuangia seranimata TaxID=408067 RepID=UPI00248B61C2|nr:nitronate monooxygenase [Yinghuangia seranimata]MDI2130303.1 nitronate monooxygenase [Yinghuangia seranimata]